MPHHNATPTQEHTLHAALLTNGTLLDSPFLLQGSTSQATSTEMCHHRSLPPSPREFGLAMELLATQFEARIITRREFELFVRQVVATHADAVAGIDLVAVGDSVRHRKP